MATRQKSLIPVSTTDLILIGGAALLIAYVGKNLKDLMSPNLGFDDEEDVTKVVQEAANNASPWSPAFYKGAPAGSLLLTNNYADSLVQQIIDSVGFFSDDFWTVLGIIKQMKTQSQVSYLADRFAIKTGSDLLTWLQGSNWPRDHYSAAEVNQLIDYVKKLPKYNV